MSTEKSKKVAVIGFGNIGTGVIEALYEKGVAGLELTRVVDIDLESPRPVTVPASYLSRDWQQAVDDPDIDIIVETMPTRDRTSSAWPWHWNGESVSGQVLSAVTP